MSATAFTRQHVGTALRQLKLNTTDPHEIAALNRAAVLMDSARWQFDGTVLKVESATHVGRVHYTVRNGRCQCPGADKHCWHAAGWRILVTANLIATVPTLKKGDVQAAVDELFESESRALPQGAHHASLMQRNTDEHQ